MNTIAYSDENDQLASLSAGKQRERMMQLSQPGVAFATVLEEEIGGFQCTMKMLKADTSWLHGLMWRQLRTTSWHCFSDIARNAEAFFDCKTSNEWNVTALQNFADSADLSNEQHNATDWQLWSWLLLWVVCMSSKDEWTMSREETLGEFFFTGKQKMPTRVPQC